MQDPIWNYLHYEENNQHISAAMREFQENKNICILSADTSTVILYSWEYLAKFNTLPLDSNYKVTSHNPIKQAEQKIKKLIPQSIWKQVDTHVHQTTTTSSATGSLTHRITTYLHRINLTTIPTPAFHVESS
jgi:hypothetical protein